jgi:hypothetical protein
MPGLTLTVLLNSPVYATTAMVLTRERFDRDAATAQH